MPATIDADSDVFTVMVRLVVDPADQDELAQIAMAMGDVFSSQPGFISMSLHKSIDGTRIVNYLQWRDDLAHDACQANPDVASRGARFMEYIQAGKAKMEVTTFDVVQVVDEYTGPTG